MLDIPGALLHHFPLKGSGGASPSAVVRQTISGYKFVAMCQQRQQRRPVGALACGRGSVTPPAPFLLRVLRVTYSQPIPTVHVKQTDLCARANNVSYEAFDDVTGPILTC